MGKGLLPFFYRLHWQRSLPFYLTKECIFYKETWLYHHVGRVWGKELIEAFICFLKTWDYWLYFLLIRQANKLFFIEAYKKNKRHVFLENMHFLALKQSLAWDKRGIAIHLWTKMRDLLCHLSLVFLFFFPPPPVNEQVISSCRLEKLNL